MANFQIQIENKNFKNTPKTINYYYINTSFTGEVTIVNANNKSVLYYNRSFNRCRM